MQVAIAVRACQGGVGAIGVDDPAVGFRKQHAFGKGIDKGPADVFVLPAAAQPHQADGAREQRDHANDGQDSEKSEEKRFGATRSDQHEPKRRPDNPEREDDQPADAGQPLGTVQDRFDTRRLVRAIAHGRPPLASACSHSFRQHESVATRLRAPYAAG